jgi:hypothetical protein
LLDGGLLRKADGWGLVVSTGRSVRRGFLVQGLNVDG